MSRQADQDTTDIRTLKKQVDALSERIETLEKRLGESETVRGITHPVTNEEEHGNGLGLSDQFTNDAIESKIGEHGMAWLGNIVLLVGIMFFIQLLSGQGLRIISLLFGFGAVAGVYILGARTGKQFPLMSKLFTMNGHLLLFYTTLRLHFISDPLIANRIAGVIPVCLALASLIYLSIRNRSQLLAGLAIIMGTILAILTNSTHAMLSIMAIVAFMSIYFAIKFEWWATLIVSICLVYISYLLWLLNNPLISGKLVAVTEHKMSHLYLIAYAFLFSLLALVRPGDKTSAKVVNGSIILNGLGFSLTIMLVIISFFQDTYLLFLGLISGFCILYSVILQYRGDWKLSAALYALYGFVVFSVTVSIYYRFPLAFMLLSIQSLLVVSMALWFRSRFIVIINVILFTGLLITYLALKDPVHSANISFALVALVTARVLNWKKNRLNIQTEFIRNLYLFAGFIMVLISLYHAVPDDYESLSWTLAALMFFLLSIVLSNVKYRYLAIAAMAATALHVFLFDLKNISVGYRVLALLFLAVISIGVSIFYARKKRSEDNTA